MIHRRAKPHEIFDTVNRLTGIDPSALCGPNRHAEVVNARVLFIVLCRRFTLASFPEIGKHLGKGHSTVITAWQRRDREHVKHYLDRYMADAVEYLEGCNGILWRD